MDGGDHVPPAGQLAVVVNPSKFDDLDAVKADVAKLCRDSGWAEPKWYETSTQDPGAGQARQALDDGATVVCSLGGDGTVRSVASALVDTGVPLGLLPGGTGNLLARNLGLPVDNPVAALEVVLTGTTRKVDVGAVTWDDDAEEVFLVMAGMGMDARMMGDADERIKNAVGWPAYLLSGVRALFDPGFTVRASTHDQQAKSHRARMVVVGNCGQLTGGLELIPDARLDDGQLDVVLVAPRGILGWAAVLRDLVVRRGVDRGLRRLSSDAIDVVTDRPILAELDGDEVGPRQRMATRARPGALLVKMPAAEG
jgi:diacylglycerol kinase (ATP)